MSTKWKKESLVCKGNTCRKHFRTFVVTRVFQCQHKIRDLEKLWLCAWHIYTKLRVSASFVELMFSFLFDLWIIFLGNCQSKSNWEWVVCKRKICDFVKWETTSWTKQKKRKKPSWFDDVFFQFQNSKVLMKTCMFYLRIFFQQNHNRVFWLSKIVMGLKQLRPDGI